MEPVTGTSNGECKTKKINKNIIFIQGATFPCHGHYTENFQMILVISCPYQFMEIES